MKKYLRKFGAILTAGMITISTVAVTMAADVIIAQDTKIDVQQNIGDKNISEKIENVSETEETTAGILNIVEEETVLTETIEESTIDTTEYTEENTIDTTEYTEENTIDTTEYTEENTESETINNNSSGTNINIENTNNIAINNNTGIVNIYNVIGVDVKNNENKESDVNVISDNEISITDSNIPTETQERPKIIETSETITETTEETTEQTTKMEKNKRKSSGGSRSSSRKTNTKKSSTTAKKEKDTEDEKTIENNKSSQSEKEKTIVKDNTVKNEKEKKSVCMKIGSNLMNINGKIVETDSIPYISDNYTLVPLRCISTVFDNVKVDWDGKTKTAIIKDGNTETRFVISSDKMYVNGISVIIPKAPEITKGRTYIPIRALSQSLSADVDWIPESKSVVVVK